MNKPLRRVAMAMMAMVLLLIYRLIVCRRTVV